MRGLQSKDIDENQPMLMQAEVMMLKVCMIIGCAVFWLFMISICSIWCKEEPELPSLEKKDFVEHFAANDVQLVSREDLL
jgi:hypothetical protein